MNKLRFLSTDSQKYKEYNGQSIIEKQTLNFIQILHYVQVKYKIKNIFNLIVIYFNNLLLQLAEPLNIQIRFRQETFTNK